MLDFSKNYFELFGLPVGFRLDKDILATRYRELQQVIHPDRYANASEQERRISAQGAALINEAFEALKDPVERGRYLLKLHGVELDAKASTQDMAFLMEQMELREELAEVRRRADPLEAVGALRERIHAKIKALLSQMAVELEAPSAEQLGLVADILHKLRFLRRVQSEVEEVEAGLEDELI